MQGLSGSVKVMSTVTRTSARRRAGLRAFSFGARFRALNPKP